LSAASLLFTLTALQYSMRHGRLGLPSMFDDVVYLLDAGQRLEEFYNDGIGALLKGLAVRPLRSPYSTFEAFFSFMVFGLHDWAPYAGNAVLIMGFLLLADRLTAGLKSWHKACLIAILMSFPMFARAAMTCRPDFAAALLTTAGVFAVAGTRRSKESFIRAAMRRKVAAGAIFGLAFLAKPSVFPSTLAIMFACIGAAAVCHLVRHPVRTGDVRRYWSTVRATLPCLATAFLVALPYFAVQGTRTCRYIYDNTLGDSAGVWVFHGSVWQNVAYYVLGPGADGMLHGQLLVLEISIAAAALFYLAGGRWRHLTGSVPVAAALAAAYAACTVNRMKNDFLGATFQALLVFSVVAVLRNVLVSQHVRRQLPWGQAVLLLVTLCAILGFRWPDRIGSPGAAANRAQITVTEQLFDACRSHAGRAAGSVAPTRVFLTFTGRINAALLNYMALKQDVPVLFYDHSVDRHLDRYIAELGSPDIVVAADLETGPGLSSDEVGFVAQYVPNAGLRARLLSAIRACSSYALVATVQYPSNPWRFYIFVRRLN
jgi:hypothetical protein